MYLILSPMSDIMIDILAIIYASGFIFFLGFDIGEDYGGGFFVLKYLPFYVIGALLWPIGILRDIAFLILIKR